MSNMAPMGVSMFARTPGFVESAHGVRALGHELKDLNRNAQAAGAGTGRAFAQLAGGFTALVVARRAAQSVFSVIKPSLQLSESLATLKGFTMAGADEMMRMRDAALEASKATAFSPQEGIEGMLELRRASLSTGASVKSILPVMVLAQAGQMKVGTAAQVARGLVRGFGVSVDELPAKLDTVARAGKLAGAGFEELAKAVPLLTRAADAGSQSLESLLLWFLLVRGKIPATRRSFTQMSRAMWELDKPKAASALKEIGVEATNVHGEIKQMPELLSNLVTARAIHGPVMFKKALRDALGTASVKPIMTAVNALAAGGNFAGTGFVQGAEGVAKLEAAIKSSEPTLKKFIEEEMKPATRQAEILNESMVKLSITLFDDLDPILASVASFMSRIVDRINDIMKALDPVSSIIAGTVVGLVLLSAAITGVIATIVILTVVATFLRTKLVAIVQADKAVQAASVQTIPGVMAQAAAFRSMGRAAQAATVATRALSWGMRALQWATGIGAIVAVAGILWEVKNMMDPMSGMGGLGGKDEEGEKEAAMMDKFLKGFDESVDKQTESLKEFVDRMEKLTQARPGKIDAVAIMRQLDIASGFKIPAKEAAEVREATSVVTDFLKVLRRGEKPDRQAVDAFLAGLTRVRGEFYRVGRSTKALDDIIADANAAIDENAQRYTEVRERFSRRAEPSRSETLEAMRRQLEAPLPSGGELQVGAYTRGISTEEFLARIEGQRESMKSFLFHLEKGVEKGIGKTRVDVHLGEEVHEGTARITRRNKAARGD